MSFLASVPEFLRLLGDVAIKATALLSVSLLLLACLARASAAIRHRVGSLTMLGLLLLPVLSWQLPAWHWAVLPAQTTIEPPIRVASADVEPNALPEVPLGSLPPVELPANAIPAPLPAFEEFDPPLPAPVPLAPVVAAPLPWPALLIVGGWLVGVAICLVGLGVGLWQVRRLSLHSELVRDDAWTALLNDVRQRLKFRRPIELRECPQSIVPLTWGVFRPCVLLPAAARGWAEPLRRVVLLHELAHVQRADVAYQLLGRLACAVYWFHPLAWLALRRLRLDREQACDDAVIHTGEQPSSYAEQLLEVARRSCRPGGLTLAVEMARGSSLETRVRSLFDAARSHAPLNWRSGASVLILTTSLLCLIAAIKPVERTAIAASGTGRGQEPRAEQEPATNPDQDSDGGSKLLRELRRKGAPLLKELAEKNGYGLIEGEHVKCLPPPYPPLRGESFRIWNSGVTENFLDQPSVSLIYHWNKGALTIWGMRTGEPQNPGRTVLNLCDEILGVKPQQIEGSPDLLRQAIPGDWVVRRDASEESRLKQLNTILADKARLPVRLEFRTVEQAVYVAQGKYKLTPLPGYAGEDRTQLEDRLSITDALHVFAQEKGQLSAGGTGDFQAFLDNLGSWVNSSIVDETTSGPARELSWQYFGPPDPLPNESGLDDETDRVLSNVTKQTGLTFDRALRKIRILTAENGDQLSKNQRDQEPRAEQEAEKPATAIARLRNGLTVELLGVAKPGATLAADCWAPDGGRFADLPEWPKPFSPAPQRVTHDVLLRFNGLKEGQATTFESPTLRQWMNYPENGVIQRVAIYSKDATLSLRVGFTDVDWGPWQKVDTAGDFIGEVEVPAGYEHAYDRILPVHIEQRTGETGICWENVHNQHLAEMSLVAIDKQGKTHRTYAGSLWGDSDPIHMDLFKLPIADIDHFEYRLRPYRHWVTFENISLEPGRRTEVEVKAETIPTKKENKRSDNRRGQEKRDKQAPILVHIVIAEHVMLWEGKEIVTWDEIEKRFNAFPDPSRIHPSFQFTNGAIKLGLFNSLQQEKIFPLTKHKLKLDKLSVGSLSPRAGVRFDRIKTADDLKPIEADRIEGRVLNSNGVAVADVEVLLITPLPKESPVHDVYLTHGQIRNPLEEAATRTDLEGRFRLYPPKDDPYILIAVHPDAGFGLVRKESFVENKDIKLGEWSEFTIVLPEDAEEKYVSLTSYLPEGNSLPQISLHLNSGVEEDQETPGTFVFSQVPFDLETGVSRAFPDEENHVTHHLQDVRVRLKEGESKNIELGPVSKDQKAKFLFKIRPQTKPKKESSALDPPAENSGTATTRDGQILPLADVLQLQLRGLKGAKVVTPDGKPVITLPGRFHLAVEAEQTTSTKFRLREIPGHDGVELDVELTCLPKPPELAKFLAENAVSLELQDGDVKLGGLIKFIYLPHRRPNEQWDGQFGVLTMGGEPTEDELAEVRTNLKDRGVLLVELRMHRRRAND